jgi:phenylpropionate dioxygenase-like ring-hydroxylating dioxygenase large terminal subunit
MTTVDLKHLTEAEAAGIQSFPKPAPGSWTEAAGLDTAPLDFKDSYDPEFYELEKEAVFRRAWLNVGRVEQLARPGTYFTKELEFLKVSVLVLRGMDGEIRAFHNVCSHRGNKLMWDDFPAKESSGNCREIACKYHGWRFDLEGQINYVHNAPEFFDLKAEDLALPKIHLDVWAGFIFVNLDKEPRETLREFLTPTVAALEDYPFGKLTQRYVFEVELESNWKLCQDSFQEIYHVPYVHGKLSNPSVPQTGTDKVPVMAPFFATYGKHRLITSGGAAANAKVVGVRPPERIFRAWNWGPEYTPDLGPLGDGINPGSVSPWGLDSWQLYPNFGLQPWARNWYATYHYWPTGPTSHKFVQTLYYAPPRNAAERLSQEHAANTVREYATEDAATVEATQRSIRSGARTKFFVSDQELAVRHLRKVLHDDVEAYQQEQAAKGSRG